MGDDVQATETREDVSDTSLAGMLPIPPEIAEQFPDLGKSMPPHITLIYGGEVDPAKVDDVVLVVADELWARWSDIGRAPEDMSRTIEPPHLGDVELSLAGLGYFENDDQRVAYASVAVPSELGELRARIIDRLERLGIEVARKGQPWVPHATLAFLQPGEVYEGRVPTGTWKAGTAEVWYGNDVRYRIGHGTASGVDKLERRGSQWAAFRDAGRTEVGVFGSEAEAIEGLLADKVDRELTGRADTIDERDGKWVVLSEDGAKTLGSYDTEAEARERLRQVEAAKAAKADGPTDSEESEREDGRQQVLFTPQADGSFVVTLPLGSQVHLAGARADGAAADSVPRPDSIASTVSTLARRAPAVHTERRSVTTEIIRADRITVPTDHEPIVHPDGWVTYPVFYGRGGNIQVYGDIREFRPKGEVFKRASMDTGIGGPWELRHSRDLLNPNTVRGVVRGVMLTFDEYQDGEHTFGWARAWDRGLMEAIEGDGVSRPEAPEVSLAYRCKAHREPGTDDYGNPFDQWISDIVINSLASEPYGRAETARVLGVRSDAGEAITVHGADELLALADKPPKTVVVFDPGSFARFDRATSRVPDPPVPTRHDGDHQHTTQDAAPMKKLLQAAKALGMAEDAIATAIGVAVEDLAPLMAGDKELTPDQVNALIMALPESGAPAEAESDMVKVEIGETEAMVPKAVATEIEALVAKATASESEAQDAKKRADRANDRANTLQKELDTAEVELAKRSDALKTMIPRADADKMVQDRALHLAGAMDLAKRGHGADWSPEARKDADGADLPVTEADWETAAIHVAFGDRADAVLARIDAAPNPEARAYAMQERLADARLILDERDTKRADKSSAARAEVAKLRSENAAADANRQDGDEDVLGKAHQTNAQYSGAVGTPQPQAHGAA